VTSRSGARNREVESRAMVYCAVRPNASAVAIDNAVYRGESDHAALQERRDAYRTHRKSLNHDDQASQLKEIRDGGGLELPNYHCAQDVLKRVEKTFQAFFHRIKKGQKPGFPRFKPARYATDALRAGSRCAERLKIRIKGA
jgi:hypothetical protein